MTVERRKRRAERELPGRRNVRAEPFCSSHIVLTEIVRRGAKDHAQIGTSKLAQAGITYRPQGAAQGKSTV
jgi:hypothetical protein